MIEREAKISISQSEYDHLLDLSSKGSKYDILTHYYDDEDFTLFGLNATFRERYWRRSDKASEFKLKMPIKSGVVRECKEIDAGPLGMNIRQVVPSLGEVTPVCSSQINRNILFFIKDKFPFTVDEVKPHIGDPFYEVEIEDRGGSYRSVEERIDLLKVLLNKRNLDFVDLNKYQKTLNAYRQKKQEDKA